MTNPIRLDLEFRPSSYWDPKGPATAILSTIKGELRRRMARDIITAEGAERARNDEILGGEVESDLLGENAPEGFTTQLSMLTSPQWLGGETLPDLAKGEVEIARVTLDSTTLDVMSIRARRGRQGIRYRMVDDNGGVRYRVRPKTSAKPLTMRELIGLIDTVKSLDFRGDDFTQSIWDWSAYCTDPATATRKDFDPEAAAGAVDFVDISSEFYPQLRRYYQRKAKEWYARRMRENTY